jgi:hypothetical protein
MKIKLLAAIICIFPVFAQSTLQLRGQITDPSKAVIPGATVSLSGANNFLRSAGTDAEGRYVLPSLAPGKYVFRVSSTGFATLERRVDISGDRPITLDVALKLAVETQQVTVADTSEVALDPSDPSRNVGALILKGDDLQMLSDNPEDLASDLQALAGPSAGPNGGQIFIDGFSGGRIPPKESIREVRINSNPFSSEYDKPGFGRIEIFTKPGTDRFRGQAFFNFSDAVFNARNPFSTIRPPYQQRFFGGNISGPLGKKASFFLDAERRNQDETSVINAVTLDAGFNPANVQTAILNPTIRTGVNARVDYQLNANNTLAARYGFSNNESINEGITSLSLPSRAFDLTGRDHTVQLTETAVIGAKMINETRFQYLWNRQDQDGVSTTPGLNVLDSFVGGGSPIDLNYTRNRRWEVTNISTITAGPHIVKFGGRFRGVNLADQATDNYNGLYTFSTLRAFQIQEEGMAAGLTNEQIRQLGGGPSQFLVAGGNPLMSVPQFDAGVFIQDDWRVKPNFTLSTGLRYENQTNISSKFNFAPRLGFAWGIGKPGGMMRSPKTVIRGGWGMFYDRFDENLTLNANRLNGVNQQQFLVPFPLFYPNVPTIDQLQPFKQDRAINLVDSNLDAPYMMQTAIGIERQLPKNITVAVNYTNTSGVHQLRSRNINAPLPGTVTIQNPQGQRPFGNEVGNLYQYEASGLFKQNQLITNFRAPVNARVMLFGFYMLNYARGDTDGVGSFPANQFDLTSEWGRARFDVRHRFLMGSSLTMWRGISLSPFLIASSGIPFNITLGRDLNQDSLFTDRPSLAAPGATGPNIVTTKFGTFNILPGANDQLIARNYAEGPGQFILNLRVAKTWGWGERSTANPQDMMGQMPSGPPPGGMRGGPGGPPGGGGGMRGGPGGGGPPGMFGGGNSGKKYSLTFSASARNLLNNVNPAPPIGTLTSPLFGESNQLAGGFFANATANRRIDLQLRFAF